MLNSLYCKLVLVPRGQLLALAGPGKMFQKSGLPTGFLKQFANTFLGHMHGKLSVKRNLRSARKLEHWFRCGGVRMVHHRVLRQLYKAAWSEKSSICAFGENPLAWSREFRDRAWWECK